MQIFWTADKKMNMFLFHQTDVLNGKRTLRKPFEMDILHFEHLLWLCNPFWLRKKDWTMERDKCDVKHCKNENITGSISNLIKPNPYSARVI